MSATGRSKPRLGRQEWIEASIDELIASGICSVTIDHLANRLGVSRGSFYHHFADRRELLLAMLEYWAQEWTYSVANQIASLRLDPTNALLVLLRTISNNRGAELDLPIRAWALHDKQARDVVTKVDMARMDIIRKQFQALSFPELEAENRARLFLYYEIVSPSIFARPSSGDEERLLVERHRFLTDIWG